jgi:methylenetetrahydrofolate reductase (NADPH)
MTTLAVAESRLARALKGGGPAALTAELLPPPGADGAALRRLAASLPSSVHAWVVADCPGDLRPSAASCAPLLLEAKVEPILPLAVRDRNRIALQSEALGAALMGVSNVLCLSGTHQALGGCPQAASAFDVDPVQLLQMLKNLGQEAVLPGGTRVEPPPELFLGAEAHPGLRPLKLSLLQVEKKVAAGARFLLTSPVWDVEEFGKWMTAVRDEGLHEKVHVIAALRPLAGVEQAESLRKRRLADAPPEAILDRLRKSTHPAPEGIAIAAETALRLKEMAGVRGLHILSAGRESEVSTLIEKAGLNRA